MRGDSLGQMMASPHRRYAPTGEGDDSPGFRRELAYGLAAIALVAFGVVVWNAYGVGAGPAPRLTPPAAAYKLAAPANVTAPDAAEQGALDDVMSGRSGADQPIAVRPGPEQPVAPPPAPASRPQLTAAPAFVASGPFVAQVAALQSEAAVDPAWRRLSSRAPDLFASAHLDVERADLGGRGVYYRVRVGYFADRDNVARFCDRIKAMGQDCIAVTR